MLLLPQPFGPTIAVIPGSSRTTVLSANDLKPISSSCLKYIYTNQPRLNEPARNIVLVIVIGSSVSMRQET